MSVDLTQAREALADPFVLERLEHGYRLGVVHRGARIEMVDVAHLRAALAEVDRLTAEDAAAVEQINALAEDNDRLAARVTELEQARARDVAGIAAHVRALKVDASAKHAPWKRIFRLIADAIERGDWHDGTLPADPRDARIAELEAAARAVLSLTGKPLDEIDAALDVRR